MIDFSVIDTNKLINLVKYDQNNPLLFNTGLFLILFIAFIGIYQILRKHRTVKFLFVIAFSLYFYYKSSAIYCFILLGVCVMDYLLGIIMEWCHKDWQRRIVVLTNVVINIGMLVYFKYINLIFQTFANITGAQFDPLNILLPAGISFFTFRSISYIVDIYRGDIKACRDFLAYTFYLTFFPPLLAGPVVRAKEMLPQVASNPVASRAMTSEGLFLIMCGLVKKVVVADYIGPNFVDRIFDNPGLYSGFETIVGIYGYAIQLYCDFSGYSDMAIGIALLLGYQFKDNFRSPFKSQNPTEFWRRWHISLSTWLRDYVYIPMGGNRKGKGRRNVNLMSTMLIGGLWHGASWMYLIWGGLHGVFLVVHKFFSDLFGFNRSPKDQSKELHARNTWWKRIFNIILTFNLVTLAFVFFRADSLESIKIMWANISGNFHADIAPQFWEGYSVIILIIVSAYLIHFAPEKWTAKLKDWYHISPLLLQAIILAVVIFIVIQSRQSDIVPFAYLKY